MNVSCRRYGRAAGGAAMGAGAPLPVGRGDVLVRRSGRAPGGAAVGAGERLPVGQTEVRTLFPGPSLDSGVGPGAAIIVTA